MGFTPFSLHFFTYQDVSNQLSLQLRAESVGAVADRAASYLSHNHASRRELA